MNNMVKKVSLAVVAAVATACAALADAPSIKVDSVQQRYPWNNKVDVGYTLADLDTTHAYALGFRLVRGAVTNDIATGEQIAPEITTLKGKFTFEISSTMAPDFYNLFDTNTVTVSGTLMDLGDRTIKLDSGDGVTYVKGDYLILDLATGATELKKNVGYEAFLDFTNDVYKTEMMVFRKVPAGKFMMKAEDTVNGACTTGVGPITLKDDYFIGIYEMTVAQYEMAKDGAIATAGDAGKLPKDSLSYDALTVASGTSVIAPLNAKCEKKGYLASLPNEAQWERATRAGTTTPVFYGASANATKLKEYAWYGGKTASQEVGLLKPNAWGLYDVYGNMRELMSDCYEANYGATTSGKTGTGVYVMNQPGGDMSLRYGSDFSDTSKSYVVRNGLYTSSSVSDFTSNSRNSLARDNTTSTKVYYGCRLVLTAFEGVDHSDDGVTFEPGDYAVVCLTNGTVTVTNGVQNADAFADDMYKTTHMVFRKVPAGSFMMYADDKANGQHATGMKVTLADDYLIAVYECTLGQYNWVVSGKNNATAADSVKPYGNVPTGLTTVIGKAETDTSFATKLNALMSAAGAGYVATLPNEAEWERAARAGTTTRCHWGTSTADYGDYVANFQKGSKAAVGSKKPNAWGLYDTIGNVWELCLEKFSYNLVASSQPGGVASSESTSYLRRGNDANSSAKVYNNSSLGRLSYTSASPYTGFRMVLHEQAYEDALDHTELVDGASPDPAKYFVPGDYLVFDLTTGAREERKDVTDAYAFTNDVYKTDKIVFRRIPACKFAFQGRENANGQFSTSTIESLEEYYAAIYELTQKQYENLGLVLPTCVTKGDAHPVNGCSYDDFATGETNVLTEMQAKVGGGFTVALPTRRQWECAARAGTTTTRYFEGGLALSKFARYNSSSTLAVGSKLPNTWGFYDVLGNVYEWTTDDFGSSGAALNEYACGGSYGTSSDDAKYLQCDGAYSWTRTGNKQKAGIRFVMTVNRSEIVDAESEAEALPLDTREGVRQVTDEMGVLPITYSASNWGETAADAATVTLEETGATLVDAATDDGTVVWTDVQNGTNTLTHTAGDVTLTAQFELPIYAYAVTLNKNGGECEDLTSYRAGVVTTLPVATKTELSFGGWYTNATFLGEVWTEIGATETGDKEFWARWVKTTVTTDDDGNKLTVKVPEAWVTAMGVSDVGATGANGIPVWKSYVLGLDPNDADSKLVAMAPQTADESTLTISLGDGFNPRSDAGVGITYRLDISSDGSSWTDGTAQEGPTFVTELPASGVRYYRIMTHMSKK